MEDERNEEKEAFLTSLGFQSFGEVWKNEAGEVSRGFIEDHTVNELKQKVSRKLKDFEERKRKFILFNFCR